MIGPQADTTGVSATSAGAHVAISGAAFFNDGIGLGQYSATNADAPLMRLFSQGAIPMTDLCYSNTGSHASGTCADGTSNCGHLSTSASFCPNGANGNCQCTWGGFFNGGGSAVNPCVTAGCYQHLVSGAITGTFFSNDQHKVLIDPPALFAGTSTSGRDGLWETPNHKCVHRTARTCPAHSP